LQESGIDGGGPLLALGGIGVLVERTFEDGIARKDAGQLVPTRGQVRAGDVEDAADRGLVGLGRLDAAIVDGKFREAGQDRQGQRRSSIARFGSPRADLLLEPFFVHLLSKRQQQDH